MIGPIVERWRHAPAMRTGPRAVMLGLLWLLGACAAPDYTPMREWAGTASRAADYSALAATCHVRPNAAVPRPAPWPVAARAMQTSLALYLSSLATMAADGVLTHREDPLVEPAADAALASHEAGQAVAGLGAVLRRATRRNARAPELAETITKADPHLQALIPILSSSVGERAAAARSDRAAVAASHSDAAAAANDPATRRLIGDMAVLHDQDYAVRAVARTNYIAVLAGIAEGHALLMERRDRLSQAATGREVRAAEDRLRRAADQLPRVLGAWLAGTPCAAPTGAPLARHPTGAGS